MKNKINRRNFALQGSAIVLGLLGINKFTVSTSSQSNHTKTLPDDFLGRLPKMMEFAGVPGVAIAVVEKGRLSWSKEF